jgi:hypothetical protein
MTGFTSISMPKVAFRSTGEGSTNVATPRVVFVEVSARLIVPRGLQQGPRALGGGAGHAHLPAASGVTVMTGGP